MDSDVGCLPYFNLSVVEVAETVFPGPGRLFGRNVSAPGAGATVYLQIYDSLLADVIVGTTVPVQSWPIPNGAVLDDSPVKPLSFGKGCCIAVTATATGAGAPGAGAIVNFSTLTDGYNS